MFKGIFTKDYASLITVLMCSTESLKKGLAENRRSVEKTSKVYSDYRAISEKEAELNKSTSNNERRDKEVLPTPPQLLTETQAGVISAYIISKLLSKPNIITVPQVVNQPEVSTGVDNFMISCQNKFDWRLKLNKTIHGMTKHGPSGIVIIPRVEGIDFETITPGNGYMNSHTKEGMCILKKNYNWLMDLVSLNSTFLTTLGKKIAEEPSVLHHINAKNYSMGYHEIDNKACDSDKDMSGLTHQERLTAILDAIPVPISVDEQKAYKGTLIKDCDMCFPDDGKFGKVETLDKLKVMSKDYEITFNTVDLDSRLADIEAIPNLTNIEGQNRKRYLIVSIHGFPIIVRHITTDMIIVADLFLSSDNEKACTLVESLEATEKYNLDYHRSVLIGLKDIINQENVWFDPEVFQEDENGRHQLKSSTDLKGEPINFSRHVYELDSPAANIAAITQTLPPPSVIADDITGNNPMLSAQHVKGNRTQIEGQRLSTNSESRFFVFAGNFYMTIINSLAKSAIELITANPSWVETYSVEQDAMIKVTASELIKYSKHFYQEQTGLIPTSLGSPEAAQGLMNLFATIPTLSEERDIGDVVTYFAKSLGFTDFPDLRRPHNRDSRINTQGQSDLDPAKSLLAQQLAQGNQSTQEGQASSQLTPEEELARQEATSAGNVPPIV